jgi:3-hydroxyanthranilate 3,4-dioxygenase
MKPFSTRNVLKWVEENRGKLNKPIMSHERVWADGFLVMLFDGPTPKNRCDFHINTSPEFFYQLVGDMNCRIIESGRRTDLVVREGEMFLLPANVPHLNTRDQGSLGIVVHQMRAPGAKDSIVWYCEECWNQLFRADYVFEDLNAQLPIFVREFLSNEKLRTCQQCRTLMPADRGFM